MPTIDLNVLTAAILEETKARIAKKKQSNKKYTKLDLFSAMYFKIETLTEADMLVVRQNVIDTLITEGYNVDADADRVYLEDKNEPAT
jgi:hypothetical protein